MGGALRERRLVSVLFCDLVAFTTFSEKHDHEEVRDLLGQYFAAASEAIRIYGGTIEKFIGDAVMAVWGAPIAREDDAERAVRAGLELTLAVASLAAELRMPELQVRVGVLTGEAAVDIGKVHEGMVIGDTVNTAARIQSIAPPGHVLVDDLTRLATERSIAYEDAGTHAVKGRAALVRVWQAVGVRPARGRIAAMEPPLAGRDLELGRLRGALDALTHYGGGIRLVALVGEAGLGKSRLAFELRGHAEAIGADVQWLSGQVLAFGGGTGFSALSEVFRTIGGIEAEDPPARQREHVEAWLASLQPAGAANATDVRQLSRALLRLLELDEGSEQLEPGVLFSMWRMALELAAACTPIVLVLEELQRAERDLLAFVRHLLEWSRSARILVLAVGRPGDWLDAIGTLGTRIELAPLSPESMDDLVAGIVPKAPQALLDAVRGDGGGVPLFAVETLRTLAASGLLVAAEDHYVVRGNLHDLSIPPTVRALVASRIDQLATFERRALAGGAVLGERFGAAGAAALSELDPNEVRVLLDGLVSKAFLEANPGGYRFLQGVVRRVVLSTLARRDRRRLHLAAVTFLEEQSAAQPVPELAAQLAGHLLAAFQADPAAADASQLQVRGAVMLREAAARAAAVGGLEQAISLYDRAVELTEDEATQAELLEQAGAIAHRAGTSDIAADRYLRAGALHQAAGRMRRRLVARAHELRALRYTRPPAELRDQLRELAAALSDRDDAAAALVGAVLAFTLYQCDEPAEALAVAARAAATAEACSAWSELAMALGAQAAALSELDRIDEAIEVYRRSLVVPAPERHKASLHGNLGLALGALGRYAEAVAETRAGIDAARRAGDRAFDRWNHYVLGRPLCSLGAWDETLGELEPVRDSVPPFQAGMVAAPLVRIALGQGDEARVRELISDYDRCCEGTDIGVSATDFRALRAGALAILDGDDRTLARVIPDAASGDYAEWGGWVAPIVDGLLHLDDDAPLSAALHSLRSSGQMKRTPPVQAQAERLAAHVAARRGEKEAALAAWDRAHALASGCGMRWEAAVIAHERDGKPTPPIRPRPRRNGG